MPKMKEANVHGKVTLKFSSNLVSMYYKELLERFVWHYTEADGDRRRLADTEIANEDPNDESDADFDQEIENILICNILKMTNSLKVELIPSATDVEMKAFNWTVQYVDT